MGAKVTFGSSYEALQFASENRTKIILDGATPPYIYEPLEVRNAWNLLYVRLMISGQAIGGDTVLATKVTPQEIITSNKGNVINKISYEKLFLFSDKNVIGLPPPVTISTNYKVIDFLLPLSLSVPHLHHLQTKDNFVSDVFLVKEGKRMRTELYAISHLTQQQLEDFSYSDTMVKFKCEDLLKQHGFTGAKNGRTNLLIKLEGMAREIIKPMDTYADTDKIKFIYGN
jgi:hypothetical protein